MKTSREAWGLLAPALVMYVLFAIPTYALGLLGVVFEIGAYGRGWIGLEAVREVLASQRFWQSLAVTGWFVAANVPVTVLVTIAVAVVINMAKPRMRGYLRMAYFVPTATSGMTISIVWRWLLAPQGPINTILGTQIQFFGQAPYAFHSINLMVFVSSLGLMVLYLSAALAAIDPELYEAARLDGCNRAQEAYHITVPAVLPILGYLTVMRAVGMMQVYQFPYALTGGGPQRTTMTTMLLIYQEAAINGRPAHAAAMSLFLLAMSVGVLLGWNKISGRSLL